MSGNSKIVLEKNINGRNVVLRAPQIEDASRTADYWFGPQSAHLLPFTDRSLFGTKDEYLARMEKALGGISSQGPWTTLMADVDGATSGTVLINGLVPSEEAQVHVHIWDPSLRRTGIATEFARDVFDYFLRSFSLKRLILQVPVENLPVVGLLESLGLKSEGPFFGKAAPVCKEGHYLRFVIHRAGEHPVRP